MVVGSQVGVTGQQSVRLQDVGTGTLLNRTLIHVGAVENATHTLIHFASGVSGTQSWRLQAKTSAGTMDTASADIAPGVLMVEDVTLGL
jgi:hypothetical protein